MWLCVCVCVSVCKLCDEEDIRHYNTPIVVDWVWGVGASVRQMCMCGREMEGERGILATPTIVCA